MENDALPERGEPIVHPLTALGLGIGTLSAAEIDILRRVMSTDRDDDRPWFNVFMDSREGE